MVMNIYQNGKHNGDGKKNVTEKVGNKRISKLTLQRIKEMLQKLCFGGF
jgi:hypothetical protein